jgi:hypothetical protein
MVRHKFTRPQWLSLLWLGIFFLMVAGFLVGPILLTAQIGRGQPAAAPNLAPQAPAAESAITNAPYDQLRPAIAYNPSANNYLVAYEDHQYASGTDWDIFVASVGTNGVASSWTNVTYADSSPQMAAALTYAAAGNEYLVVWEHTFSATDHDIYASRVNSAGQVVSNWLPVATSSAWDESPAVAYNSNLNQYLVVWQRRIGDPEFPKYDIYCQRLAADGSKIGTEVALDAATTDQRNPAAAYNSLAGEYLIVWQDEHPTYHDLDIMGRRLSDSGGLIGDELTIEAPGLDQARPNLAYNSHTNEYLVVWEDHWGGSTSDWDIKGARLNGSAERINWFMISSNGTQRRMYPVIASQPSAGEYLVAYDYEFSLTDHDVYYSRLAWDGTARQTDAVLKSTGNDEGRPAVAADSAWDDLFVWEDGRNSSTNGIDLYAAPVTVQRFEGYVWNGEVGNRASPFPGVTLGLYCSNDAGAPGNLIAAAQTDPNGFYRLLVNAVCEFYTIQETNPPGYVSAGANSLGGTVIDGDRIQYTWPISGKIMNGNEFWDRLPNTSTATPTSTRTATTTQTATTTRTPTATHTATITSTATITRTTTITLTPTVSSTSTRVPTHTFTPTRSITPTPTATQVPITITFEESIPYPDLVRSQYCNNVTANKGVEFLGNYRIIQPAWGTFSPPKALTNAIPGSEFGGMDPLDIRFTAPQSKVQLKVGLDRSYNYPVVATLYAYSSSTPGSGFVTYNTLYLGYGPTAINQDLQVYAASGDILSVRLDFAGMQSGQKAYEVLDQLTIYNPGPPCVVDNSTPQVSIYDPTYNETIYDPITSLNFSAYDPDTGIASVKVSYLDTADQVVGYFYECGGASALGCPQPSYTFSSNSMVELPLGTAKIRVEAWDFTNKKGQAIQSINYIETGANMNLWAEGMEITQAIQPWLPRVFQTRLGGTTPPNFTYPAAPDTVPMVAGRRTVVRVYGGVEDTNNNIPVTSARATLYCYKNASFTLPCPSYQYLAPVNGSITINPVDNLAARQYDANKSWNFVLPNAWTQAGTIYLEARVDPPYGAPECSGCNDAANRIRISGITFNIVPGFSQNVLHAVLVQRIQDGVPAAPAPQSDINFSIDFLRRVLPVDEATISYLPNATYTFNDSVSTADRCHPLLAELPIAFPNKAGKKAVYGFTDYWHPCAGLGGGGYGFGHTGAANYQTASEEIGHAVGMKHAGPPPGDYVECSDGAGGCDSDYPYPHGTIGAYGFDVFSMKAIPGGPDFTATSSYHDLMSYAHSDSPYWISPRTYIRFFNAFTGSNLPYPKTMAELVAEFTPGPNLPASQVDALLVRGVLADTGTWSLLPAYELPLSSGEWEEAGTGSYSIQLRNAEGTVLLERFFEPHGGHVDAREPDPVLAMPLSFEEIVPLPPGVTQLLLLHGQEVLASRTRSAHVPVVNVVSPTSNGFEGQPDNPLIRWSARDADRDALVYMVQYSPDGPDAEEWQTLGADLTQLELAVQLEMLAGSPGSAVRVLASDGFNTSQAVSPAFAVAGKPPVVDILSPADGSITQEGLPVTLEGTGWDREDGMLPDQNLDWTSDIDGPLGTGRQVILSHLSPGIHHLVLSGHDLSGAAASASLTLLVEDRPNIQPQAVAGPDWTASVCSPRLDASASLDLDSDPLVYLWSIISQPAGSQAYLSNPEAMRTYLVASQPGTYVIQLIVHDGQVASQPDQVSITVTSGTLGFCQFAPGIKR